MIPTERHLYVTYMAILLDKGCICCSKILDANVPPSYPRIKVLLCSWCTRTDRDCFIHRDPKRKAYEARVLAMLCLHWRFFPFLV